MFLSRFVRGHDVQEFVFEKVVKEAIGTSDHDVLILQVNLVLISLRGFILADSVLLLQNLEELLAFLVFLLLKEFLQVLLRRQTTQLIWYVKGMLLFL